MRPADTWKDYELLDATDGNRLERWGKTLLVRPDPQVVWKTGESTGLWQKADAVYHRSSQGGGEWEYRRRLPEKWNITDSKGETHHWCWLDAAWDQVANTDVVAWIWGENSSKKMMKSTESRANDAQNAD